MFYTINETGVHKTELQAISPMDVNAGYLTLDELQSCYEDLGFSEAAVRECENDQTFFRTSMDIYDDFSFGIINIVDVTEVHEKRDRIAIFLKKNLFVLTQLVDEDDSTRRMFESAIGRYKKDITLEKVIYAVLDRLLENGNIVVERTQNELHEMEGALISEKLNRNTNRILFDLKNKLLIQKNYYDQLVDIGEALQENENDIFETDDLRYFKVFMDKAKRLSDSTQLLCDSLVHVREAYDASINYNMNKTMQLFTVLSAVFLPLTLIVGWYGMNFTTMPELTWKYGYLFVIILSVAVAALCLWWFKRKKLF